MELERNPARGRKLAPLAQVGLAALVVGSMLTFSALAFRTGMLDDGSGRVRPSTRSADSGRPIVLPAASAGPEVAGRRERRSPDRILVSEIDPGTDVVLGTRIRPTDDLERSGRRDWNHGDGHDKGKGKGHHKRKGKGHHRNDGYGRSLDEAKEDDDDRDGHGPDDDHDDDDSGNSGSERSARGHSGGSRSNSRRNRA